MSNNLKSPEEQQLLAQAAQVRERQESLKIDLRVIDDELDDLAPQRTRYELLEQACSSLEQLKELDADSLFWGERIEPAQIAEQLQEVRNRISEFQSQIGVLDAQRNAVLAKIETEEENLDVIAEDLYQVREAEERRKLEWVIEREMSQQPRRQQIMAWARGGEDDMRFRKSLALSLLACLILGIVFPMIDLPLPDRFKKDDAVPKRLVQFIRQAQMKPIPPPPVVAERLPEQKVPEQQEPQPATEPNAPKQPPLPSDSQAAVVEEPKLPGPPDLPPGPVGPGDAIDAPPGPSPRKVANAGILAFKDQFASLAQDRIAPRLGADARLGDADDASLASSPTRSMLTTNAPGSSGGINLASLSRNVRGGGGGGGGGGTGGGGGGGGGLQGVEVGRAKSSIASIGGEERPKASDGPGLYRTDEEIQIVFDRYKAAFYRLYNRELRVNPTLQGQMVLRLTIEPDGSVSMCMMQSTDMDAPTLASQVVTRVRTINFGEKEGVEAMTIVYPIDFLPASEG
ncbi:MAG: AgmX/PglI C-terminal domain-containing protein [Acidobacteriota bacterium]